MSINKLIDEYLDYLEIEKNRSLKTRENYSHYLNKFLGWSKVSSPSDITDDLVRKYRIFLNRLEENGKSLKKVTQSYYVIALRGFLKYLSKRNIESLPAERIELGKTSVRDIDFLEANEVERLLSSPNTNTLRGLRDKAIFELLFSTGLRVSELCALNRDSINLKEKDALSIRGKGDKIRVVFLSEESRTALKNYLEKRSDVDEALFIRVPQGNLLADGSTISDLRLSPRSIQRLIKKYAAVAGISKNIHPHTLRHTFATDLLRNGADLRSVQSLLGHANITSTQVYTHITDKQLKEVHQAFHGKRRKSS